MSNKQLIDYIKNESSRGVAVESTKNALLGIGWKDGDIKEAYASLSTTPTKSKFGKKFIFIPILLLLLAGGGFFGYKFYLSSLKPKEEPYLPVELPSQNPNPPQENIETPAPAPAPVISEVDKVKTITEEICKGYVDGDNSLVAKHASIQTLTFLANAKLNTGSSCNINKIYELDSNIIANITVTPVSTDQLSTTLSPVQDMVFIKEEGVWKYDLTASLKFGMDQAKAKALIGDENGFVDLVVTKVVISPKRPIINSKDLKIVLTIKNIGTKTSENGVPLIANFLGFKDETPMTGGNYGPLMAGETIEWAWYPYKYNTLLKVSDVAGPKTIKIELNPDRKIVESNYDNNIFTQAVQMYAK